MTANAERVDLLLRVTAMPDGGNLLTWRVDGRGLTAPELHLLAGITVQDVQAVADLHMLELDVDTAFERDLGWSP